MKRIERIEDSRGRPLTRFAGGSVDFRVSFQTPNGVTVAPESLQWFLTNGDGGSIVEGQPVDNGQIDPPTGDDVVRISGLALPEGRPAKRILTVELSWNDNGESRPDVWSGMFEVLPAREYI